MAVNNIFYHHALFDQNFILKKKMMLLKYQGDCGTESSLYKQNLIRMFYLNECALNRTSLFSIENALLHIYKLLAYPMNLSLYNRSSRIMGSADN